MFMRKSGRGRLACDMLQHFRQRNVSSLAVDYPPMSEQPLSERDVCNRAAKLVCAVVQEMVA
jgi:hypothetical protein